MANEVLSSELVVVYNDLVLMCSTSFGLTVDAETIDVSCLSSADWRSILKGPKTWSIDAEGLVTRGTPQLGETDYQGLMAAIKTEKDPVNCAIKSTITDDKYEEGLAIITSLSQTGSIGAAVTYSATFSGYGALTTQTVTAQAAQEMQERIRNLQARRIEQFKAASAAIKAKK